MLSVQGWQSQIMAEGAAAIRIGHIYVFIACQVLRYLVYIFVVRQPLKA